MPDFNKIWGQATDLGGIFSDEKEKLKFKNLGKEMIKRVENNPGIFKNKAVKIKEDLLQFWLSEEEKIVLCGKIDWLEYVENKEDKPEEVDLVDYREAHKKVLNVALKIRQAINNDDLECPKDGCYHCEPYEKILEGDARFAGRGDYGDDLYIVN